jgi:hypothetical protein
MRLAALALQAMFWSGYLLGQAGWPWMAALFALLLWLALWCADREA